MNRTLLLVAGLTCLTLSGAVDAARKPSTDVAGTAAFRCNPGCIFPVLDRILGDGSTYQGFGVTDTGYGAHLSPTHEMWIGVRSGYHVRIDFSDPVGPAPCVLPGTCRRTFSLVTTEADIQSNRNFLSGLTLIPRGRFPTFTVCIKSARARRSPTSRPTLHSSHTREAMAG